MLDQDSRWWRSHFIEDDGRFSWPLLTRLPSLSGPPVVTNAWIKSFLLRLCTSLPIEAFATFYRSLRRPYKQSSATRTP